MTTELARKPQVQITLREHVRDFDAEILATYSQTSGTDSYNSFMPIPFCTIRDPILCRQDENDRPQIADEKILLLDADRPEIVDVDTQALERVNRGRAERKTGDQTAEIRVEVAKNAKAGPRGRQVENDLLCKVIAESLELGLSEANAHGKSLCISIGVTSGRQPRRTVELSSELIGTPSEDQLLDLQNIKNGTQLARKAELKSTKKTKKRPKPKQVQTVKDPRLGPPIHSAREIRQRSSRTRLASPQGRRSSASSASIVDMLTGYVKKVFRC